MPYAEESLIIKSDDSRKALITSLLGLRKRFSGKSGLVDGHIDGLGQTAIGGEKIAQFLRKNFYNKKKGGAQFSPHVTLWETMPWGNRAQQSVYCAAHNA